ncbi:MAG: sigma-54-dependent Fis family transcriptional regulator [Deltaproteobacteria bacterium]|nr:sigma-54-dependent Fis family transcriptional regulator [Deltaproteobacteria bacterium]
MPRILIAEDDRVIRFSLAQNLADAGYEVETAEGVADARRLFDAEGFDAALVDIRLKDGDGLDLLEDLRKDVPQLPVIIVTAFGDSERTIRAMKAGAFEYLTKPFELDVLLNLLDRAVKVHPTSVRVPEANQGNQLVGASPAMLNVWKSIGRSAASPVPVLITGESGVGKELVARAIHDNAHPNKPFVAVNLAALPPSLVESELFGHERGAFTGAVARREGRFELAGDGTLFLDEIADLDLPLQTKLLRVLEDGGYERVGGSTRMESKARIIAATSRNVQPGQPDSRLREDLYYRLAVLRIEVPPLRERKQDIPLLVQAFLRRAGRSSRALSEGAMNRLVSFGWPGNVRQLRHVLENACVMSTAEVLDEAAFDLGTSKQATDVPTWQMPVASELTNLDLRENLERFERELIELALSRAQGNRAQAARLLGIRRALLYSRMLHLGMRGAEPVE